MCFLPLYPLKRVESGLTKTENRLRLALARDYVCLNEMLFKEWVEGFISKSSFIENANTCYIRKKQRHGC
jgi:hypothetical protein